MVRQGLLATVRSDRAPGAPNLYSVTIKARRAAGSPTVKALREAIAAQFTPAQLAMIGDTVQRRATS